MNVQNDIKRQYVANLLKWYKTNKRAFPWRTSAEPYHILLAEILLQKTNAANVVPVFNAFIVKYPDIQALSKAKVADVRRMLRDLGLRYRVERVLSVARFILKNYNGNVPQDKETLSAITGLGPYISAAVSCFAFNKRESIVDTNVVRVLERVFGLKSQKTRQRDDKLLWEFAATLLPDKKYKDYNYALLDFGAVQCTAKNPVHESCPLKGSCLYYNKTRTTKKKPIGIDIFAGAGGLSLGFEQAGFKIAYAIEKDKHAAETYKRNRESQQDLFVDTRDIKNINPKEVLKTLGKKRGELDIVIGGPPCQGFSQSNMKTRNLANPQNQLVFKFIEFVNGLKPKWFLMENVAGLDSFEDGLFRDLLLKEFKSIGYQTKSIILNSVNFGVPQSRNRVFFIGNRVGDKMVFVPSLATQKADTPVTVLEAISDLPELPNGHMTDEMNYTQSNRGLSLFQKQMRIGMHGRVQNNLTTNHSDLVIQRFQNIKSGENLLSLAKRKPELTQNYKNVENCHFWIYLRLPWEKPSVTLNNFRKNMLIHPVQNRGLSVREAARLQSFPDRYVFFGSIGFQQQQVSNAVPPLMSESLAQRINLSALTDAEVSL